MRRTGSYIARERKRERKDVSFELSARGDPPIYFRPSVSPFSGVSTNQAHFLSRSPSVSWKLKRGECSSETNGLWGCEQCLWLLVRE